MIALLLAALIGSPVRSFRPPNLVLVVADDLGYSDLGCYGGTRIPTPNIDAVAAQGIRMTSGYVTCPMCAPSRAGIMTSQYPQRFGFEFNPAAGTIYGIPRSVPTLAERLRAIGYATAAVGKWHLGETAPQTPLDRGFQSFFGFYGGASRYLPFTPAGLELIEGRSPVRVKEYLTDAFTRRAVDFVNHSYTRPFFLYLAYNAVHLPYEAPKSYLDRFPQYTGDQKIYAAMVSALDDGVGKVRAAIRAKGLESETLFVFLSDNGGNTANGPAQNKPFRGGKNTMFEGGVHVPFLASWPGRLPKGVDYPRQTSAMDIGPTFLASTGFPIPAEQGLNGKSLLPFWEGEDRSTPHPALYWRMGQERAARIGDVKYVATDRTPGRVWTEMLFDLGIDLDESRSLVSKEPNQLSFVRSAWSKWSQGLKNPAWPNG
jgi:arylsulfatase A-like enzyme